MLAYPDPKSDTYTNFARGCGDRRGDTGGAGGQTVSVLRSLGCVSVNGRDQCVKCRLSHQCFLSIAITLLVRMKSVLGIQFTKSSMYDHVRVCGAKQQSQLQHLKNNNNNLCIHPSFSASIR